MYVGKCRMCNCAKLKNCLILVGHHPPTIFSAQLSEKEQVYPLEVVICDDCGLVQLNYVVPPGRSCTCNEYPYESFTTSSGRRHWKEFAETTKRMLKFGAEDLIVDVGSNVGVLLQMFKSQGAHVLSVDPAQNIAAIANRNGIETLRVFQRDDGRPHCGHAWAGQRHNRYECVRPRRSPVRLHSGGGRAPERYRCTRR